MSEKMSRADRARQRQENSGKKGGGFQKVLNIPEDVTVFKRGIEEQQNIAIVPFKVTSDIHPEYKAIMKDVEEFGDPATAFKFEYYVHNVPGMGKEVICHNMTYGKRTCPICAERFRLMDEGYTWDSKEVKPYNAKHRTAHVVCLLDDPETPLAVMDESWGWWGKVIEEKAKEQNVLFLDETEHGKNLQVFSMEHTWKSDKGEEFKMAGKASVKFIDREWGFNDEDMSEIDICSFFTVDSEDDIYNAFHAISGDSSSTDEDEETVEIKPSTGRGSRGTPQVAESAPVEAVTPNPSSRRGGRGGAPTMPTGESTGRGRRDRTIPNTDATEDDITF